LENRKGFQEKGKAKGKWRVPEGIKKEERYHRGRERNGRVDACYAEKRWQEGA